jgi:hypothetical protein
MAFIGAALAGARALAAAATGAAAPDAAPAFDEAPAAGAVLALDAVALDEALAFEDADPVGPGVAQAPSAETAERTRTTPIFLFMRPIVPARSGQVPGTQWFVRRVATAITV